MQKFQFTISINSLFAWYNTLSDRKNHTCNADTTNIKLTDMCQQVGGVNLMIGGCKVQSSIL